MKRIAVTLLAAALLASLATACLSSTAPSAAPEASPNDAVTSASEKESSNPADIIKGLSADGYWIFSVLSDVTIDSELTVSGTFYQSNDTTAAVYRKFALYAQDADRNVTATYTVTVPQITVESPNFRIQEGTIKGNVVVNADGFELANCTIDGDLTFKTQAQKDSAKLEEGTVTGTVSVG